jgi:alanine racemase
MRSTRAFINLENFKSNIKTVKSFTKEGTKILVPVKANAYGHGMILCAKAAIEAGANFLSVACVDEGIELRKNGITIPILLFSPANPSEIEDLVKNKITPFVFDKEMVDLIDNAITSLKSKGYNFENKFPLHLAVDSGMGRIGAKGKQIVEVAKYIASKQNLELEGICTHFAVSDSILDDNRKFTKKQFEVFTNAIKDVKKAGINPKICHCANSAASLDLPQTHMDMIRPGIILYGYYADEINEKYLKNKNTPCLLKPVMTLETQVCSISTFNKGDSVGYGRTWTAEEKTEIAVLPIGYGDGWFRRFSTCKIKVAINGKAYPIVGRICMDQCMVNLGLNSGVKRWDKVVLFGEKERGALQTAEDIAKLTDTISYEITTGIEARVPRVTKE